MPYIKAERRAQLYPQLKDYTNTPGELNFVITKLCLNHLRAQRKEKSYEGYNEVMGVLECVKQELYRREIGNYESLKMQENGDVF